MKRRTFVISTAGALTWLLLSSVIAGYWVREAAQRLPWCYTVWVVMGIALLPGYLTSAMFLSNMMHARPSTAPQDKAAPVSVLICARNEEKTIYRTIEAVVAQRYAAPIEILCVDNGSDDHTRQEIERAEQSLVRPDRMIRLISCPAAGKANALNEGLAHIRTDAFVTVDADTLLEENALAAILARRESSGAACVAGNLLAAGTDSWVGRMQIYDYLISIAAVKRYQGSYGVTLVAQGAFSAYETHAVRQIGGWTQGAGEDIVLTYRLLALGRLSLYEPRAIGFTVVPRTLRGLWRQRARWARGMFEGLHAVKPWQQPTLYGGYFEALNLSVLYLDLAYVFGFLVGIVLALLGMPWLAGGATLLTLPALAVVMASVYAFQRRVAGVHVKNSVAGLLCFAVLFQPVQSLCSLDGYARALLGCRVRWKT
ncbi:MAG: glycosyltransferase family 2 protein [Candidatus Limiplasma sp.]|nr:glycosyltransferase family 2 protein [Candidatus Limiplasma sp.]